MRPDPEGLPPSPRGGGARCRVPGGAATGPEALARAPSRGGSAARRARAGSRVVALLLLAALVLAACQAVAAPRIGLVTMQPGEAYWSRFGHNAILVQHPGGPAIFYNYGYFDFEEQGFLWRFLQGKMEYLLVALPADVDLAGYRDEGRGVSLQWLALPDEAADELAAFLRWNAQPEHARYRYDYFTDNCSTKVRDALDRALGGALRRQLQGRSRGLTYRWDSLRLAAAEPWLLLGIHAGLGPWTDRPLSRWEEGFVPMRLADAVREVRLADGTPLVRSEHVLLPHRLAPVADERPRTRVAFAAAGLLLAGVMAIGLRRGGSEPGRALRRTATVLLGGAWLLAAAGGWLLAFLWTFTDHQAAWRNENLLLFSPLALALLASLPRLWRGEAVPRWARRTALLVFLLSLAAIFLKFLPWRLQDNVDWILFWVPVHAVAAWRLSQHRAAHRAGAD